ncbi:MAG: phosphate transport system regulatory protein PhoU [Saprospirales bacterium]|nr:phosphate transport system regulatory protein PhoU [Saprospirales bacterium]
MTNIEKELIQLKEDIIEMMHLVQGQLKKAGKAFSQQSIPKSKEIHKVENRVNAMELGISKDCENIIALYNPVASDLRLVLAALKIVIYLERIGDHADKIARYVRKEQITDPINPKLLDAIQFDAIFEIALEMVNDAIDGFINEDTEVARLVFVKDQNLNKLHGNAIETLAKLGESNDPDKSESMINILYLFSIVNKLERVGDLAKNIAEETIFYVEAKVLKHTKVTKKKK